MMMMRRRRLRLATGNPLCIVNLKGPKMMRILLECNHEYTKPSRLHLLLERWNKLQPSSAQAEVHPLEYIWVSSESPCKDHVFFWSLVLRNQGISCKPLANREECQACMVQILLEVLQAIKASGTTATWEQPIFRLQWHFPEFFKAYRRRVLKDVWYI